VVRWTADGASWAGSFSMSCKKKRAERGLGEWQLLERSAADEARCRRHFEQLCAPLDPGACERMAAWAARACPRLAQHFRRAWTVGPRAYFRADGSAEYAELFEVEGAYFVRVRKRPWAEAPPDCLAGWRVPARHVDSMLDALQ
jgi:hypothetical protein